MQAGRAALFDAYYEGVVEIVALMDTAERRTFQRFLSESSANWCELIVNAVAERLQVVGFNFDGDDGSAWKIWQASAMDADGELVQTDALVMGSSFVLVQADKANPTGVRISPESPLEATVLYEPGNRRERAAGYKRFIDGVHGETTEVLILPDVIVTWRQGSAVPEVVRNPAGEVTLIEITPQPRTLGPPRSELTPALPIQDRINTTIFSRMVATDYGAFRQIWATGVKLARQVLGPPPAVTPVDGPAPLEPPPPPAAVAFMAPFDIGANRLLANENPAGRFGHFAGDTLAGYLAAVEQDVNQLAAITQTPPHYLLGAMINLSADAIKAAEAGLVAKVKRRALHIGEGWEETIRVALRITGRPGADDPAGEVLWRDFETRSEAQTVDALVKMRTLDVPLDVLWQRWGASPQEIEQWHKMRAAEKAANPPPPALAPYAGAPPPPGSSPSSGSAPPVPPPPPGSSPSSGSGAPAPA
jgi:hypothetical protein